MKNKRKLNTLKLGKKTISNLSITGGRHVAKINISEATDPCICCTITAVDCPTTGIEF